MKIAYAAITFLLLGCAASQQEQQEPVEVNEPTPVVENVETELPNGDVKLTVLVSQNDARIRIMNIKPKYQQGIELKKGKYDIEVTKDNHKTFRKWVSIEKHTTLNVNLEQIL